MQERPGLSGAAQLFKVLGSESRLSLLLMLDAAPATVTWLAAETGMSQPLVSQHLRTLRQAGLVVSSRSGKEVIYRVADAHVTHVIGDALVHAQESPAAHSAAGTPEGEEHPDEH